jgi:hypothetical protein
LLATLEEETRQPARWCTKRAGFASLSVAAQRLHRQHRRGPSRRAATRVISMLAWAALVSLRTAWSVRFTPRTLVREKKRYRSTISSFLLNRKSSTKTGSGQMQGKHRTQMKRWLPQGRSMASREPATTRQPTSQRWPLAAMPTRRHRIR